VQRTRRKVTPRTLNTSSGAFLKIVEDNWSLAPIGSNDVRANSIGDVFDFTRPRNVSTDSRRDYAIVLEHQRASYLPVGTE
jgi:hypothetical protein